MPEMQSRQSGFTYNKNKLDKVCFQHDITYGDFNYFHRRTASDKVLHNKVFNIAKNLKYDGYQRGLLQWFIKFLVKNILVVLLKFKLCQTMEL